MFILQGDRTEEEKDILEQKIAKLNQELETTTKRWVLLNSELKKSTDDMKYPITLFLIL